MDSNKHGAMEQNEEDILTNILICHTHETELRWQSYDAMNNAPGCKNKGLSGKIEDNPRVAQIQIQRAGFEVRRGGARRSWRR